VATFAERAAHIADLRAIIAGLQAGIDARLDASALEFEPASKPKAPARGRRPDQVPTGAAD